MLFCTVLLRFFHPVCLFFLYSPLPQWRSWKMRISLSNSALLSGLQAAAVVRAERIAVAKQHFAPWVKDKEHHAQLWGRGSPVPRELWGADLGTINREMSILLIWGLGRGEFLNFLSFSLDHFSFSPKGAWPNGQRSGWQTHNLGFQDLLVPQISSLNRDASVYTLPWLSFFRLKKVKIKTNCFTKLQEINFLNSIITSSAITKPRSVIKWW